MSKSIFPEGMLGAGEQLTMDIIGARMSYFYEQIHLTHLQTTSHAEHIALNVWKEVVEAKDDILEKLMGYEGKRVKASKVTPSVDYSPGLSTKVLKDLRAFAEDLELFARSKDYADIENIAQDLSGKAAQTLYFLTMS